MHTTLTDSLELGVLVDHVGLVEQRDERLVRGLDEHELERIAIESDALESADDSIEGGTTSNC